ncbi:MAG: YeiH family protein [Steroidobacteraceae bacterium]
MPAPPITPPAGALALLPGLALAALLAAGAFGLKALGAPGVERLSPLMLAIILGMLVRNTVGRPESARAGLAASLRTPLRLGIVLLGLQVTLAEILGIGWAGLAILAFALVGTVLFTLWLGGRLGVPTGLTVLIATGTGVCGASAIVAANTVVRDSDESVAYALATITLLGTIALFAYPLLASLLPLSEAGYGLWTGASVHEVAQVVAAGFALGQQTGEFATVTKLARVLMLAPLVIALAFWWERRRVRTDGATAQSARAPMPWFVFGFLGMVLLSGTGWIEPATRSIANTTTQALLAFALAAVGLETDLRKLASQGWRPLVLGGLATLFIAVTSLLLALLWQNV